MGRRVGRQGQGWVARNQGWARNVARARGGSPGVARGQGWVAGWVAMARGGSPGVRAGSPGVGRSGGSPGVGRQGSGVGRQGWVDPSRVGRRGGSPGVGRPVLGRSAGVGRGRVARPTQAIWWATHPGTNKHTNKQTNKQTHKQTNKQTDVTTQPYPNSQRAQGSKYSARGTPPHSDITRSWGSGTLPESLSPRRRKALPDGGPRSFWSDFPDFG